MLAGFIKTDITPPVGIGLGGYGYYLHRNAQTIHDPLYARALAIASGDDKALIISCDIVALDKELVDEIKSEISRETGLSAEAIMFHCIHTHSGPSTAKMRGCGVMNEDYMKSLKTKLIDTGVQACSAMKPVTSTAYSKSDFAGIGLNRSDAEIKLIDNTINSLFIYRENNNPIVLINYACHPVVNDDDYCISADYPGQMAASLDSRKYDILFINGFCGDINPLEPRNQEEMKAKGQAIADAVIESEKSAEPLCCENIQFKVKNISVALNIPSREEILSELLDAKAKLEADPSNMLTWPVISWTADALAEIEKPDFPQFEETYLQAITIGDVAFIGFPGETFTAFGLTLKEKFKGLRIINVNTANGIIGYIPTADEFDRKGYAAEDAGHIYGIFKFKKGFGEQICDEAAELLSEISSCSC